MAESAQPGPDGPGRGRGERPAHQLPAEPSAAPAAARVARRRAAGRLPAGADRAEVDYGPVAAALGGPDRRERRLGAAQRPAELHRVRGELRAPGLPGDLEAGGG